MAKGKVKQSKNSGEVIHYPDRLIYNAVDFIEYIHSCLKSAYSSFKKPKKLEYVQITNRDGFDDSCEGFKLSGKWDKFEWGLVNSIHSAKCDKLTLEDFASQQLDGKGIHGFLIRHIPVKCISPYSIELALESNYLFDRYSSLTLKEGGKLLNSGDFDFLGAAFNIVKASSLEDVICRIIHWKRPVINEITKKDGKYNFSVAQTTER